MFNTKGINMIEPSKRGRPKLRQPGQFQKGVSGNSLGGRITTNPEVTRILMEFKDRRNQFTLSLFQRIESLGDSLITKALELAMDGNEKMLFFLLDKCINNTLIHRLEKPLLSKTAEDIDESQQFIIEKMGEGTMDVVQGMNLVKTLSLKRDTINVRKLEEQVDSIVKED
jgi:hypothetical protein